MEKRERLWHPKPHRAVDWNERLRKDAPAVQGDPVAWVYSVGDRHTVELRHYRDDELVGGCVVTPLYAAPQPAPDVTQLVEALETLLEVRVIEADASYGLACAKAEQALAAHRKQEGEQ